MGVRQRRENEKNSAMLIGMRAPVHIAARRSISIAPLSAAASSAVIEAAVFEDVVAFMLLVDDWREDATVLWSW